MAGRGKHIVKVDTPFPSVVLVKFQNSPYWWVRFWQKDKRQSFFRSTETVGSPSLVSSCLLFFRSTQALASAGTGIKNEPPITAAIATKAESFI